MNVMKMLKKRRSSLSKDSQMIAGVSKYPSQVLKKQDASVFPDTTSMKITKLVVLQAALHVTHLENASNVNQVTSHVLPVTGHVMVTVHQMAMGIVHVTAATAELTVNSNVIKNVSAVRVMSVCSVQNAMETRLVADVINVSETGIHFIIVINDHLATSTTVLMTRSVSTCVSMVRFQITI